MTPEQIKQWAREAEEYAQRNGSSDWSHHAIFNERFARLVAADTWERAAIVCVQSQRGDGRKLSRIETAERCAMAIRAEAAKDKS